MRRTTTWTAAAVAGAALSPVLTTCPATAATAPGHAATAAEAAAMTAAVQHSPLTRLVDPRDYRVMDQRVSDRDAHWAFAALVPRTHRVDLATAVLQYAHGRWTLRQVGSSETGCGAAPAPVLREFAVHCTG